MSVFSVLHDNHLTHTDLKPENILFVNSESEVVIDPQKVTTTSQNCTQFNSFLPRSRQMPFPVFKQRFLITVHLHYCLRFMWVDHLFFITPQFSQLLPYISKEMSVAFASVLRLFNFVICYSSLAESLYNNN